MMNKQKKELLLLLFLLPVLGFFVFRLIGELRETSRPRRTGPSPAAAGAGLPGPPPVIPDRIAARRAGPSAEEKARRELADRAREVGPWTRDPFLERPVEREPGAELRLQGILWHPERPLATIGGNLYGEGETVEGFTIYSIRPGTVILRRAGEEVTLTVTE